MADYLKEQGGLDAELEAGRRGEFSIWVDGKKVAEKGLLLFPSPKTVLAAVRQALGG